MTEIYAPIPDAMSRADDLLATSYDLKVVSLVDLARARMTAGKTLITGVTFTNCRIEGPAVMLPLGCHFQNSDFGNPSGDIRNLVLKPASPSAVIGAIPVDNCTFTGCQFVGIGYTGADAFLDQILALGPTQ
ncbi:MAG: hypothetical protein GC145_10550 [Caulobacter sp.]|nr:hypothetical protein [Caulobacter sp.]